MNKKCKGRKVLYEVKWKNYDDKSNTWEPIENLKNANKLVI